MAQYKNKITIPRLELLGNLILSRLIRLTKKLIFQVYKYAWSDSNVSLAWIKSYNKEFVNFVQHQVGQIRKNVLSEKWNFCSIKVNPYDLTKNSLWWRSPRALFEENQN